MTHKTDEKIMEELCEFNICSMWECDTDWEEIDNWLRITLKAVREEAYGEGYKQGKFDAEMDKDYPPNSV